MRCITDIFRPNVGNQKFALIRSLWSDIKNPIETTSVTAGLHSAGLDSLFVGSVNHSTSDHKDLTIMQEHFTHKAF